MTRLELLHASAGLRLYRFHGPLRGPDDGRHARVVIYSTPTLNLRETARELRAAADRLDDQAARA